ncbi:hypothetical protein SCUCBS95973_006598 [Sporothrix curviconia]|uniref:Uncharacterized protein n=1 Tax=Sporothrix curviconia TaxID=1260050 RepID=A0ABP0C6S9_9PEZI
MRYMTPDTPGTRSLESPVARRTEKGEEDKATMAMATALPSKREVTTPSATPTPTPSPTKAAESVETRKPARRAIRTYGKKRPLVEDTSKGNIVSQPVKRQKTTATQETTAQTAQVEMARPSTPKAHDFDVDEISRQLLKEAEEAERPNYYEEQEAVLANRASCATFNRLNHEAWPLYRRRHFCNNR